MAKTTSLFLSQNWKELSMAVAIIVDMASAHASRRSFPSDCSISLHKFIFTLALSARLFNPCIFNNGRPPRSFLASCHANQPRKGSITSVHPKLSHCKAKLCQGSDLADRGKTRSRRTEINGRRQTQFSQLSFILSSAHTP